MITKFWWLPLCASCLTIALLGQFNESPSGISSANQATLNNNQQDQQGQTDGQQPSSNSSANPLEEDNVSRKKERTDPNLFVDWPKPDFAIFLSGRQHGYIEPCGCTGLENQKGGMMRRHQFMKELIGKGWQLLPIDAGNQVKRFGIQPSLKLGKTYESLCKLMNYQAIGFGPDDLKLPATDVLQNMLNNQGDFNPFTCANVLFLDSDEFTERFRVVEVAGKKVSVTMVLGDEHLQEIKSDDLTTKGSIPAITELWPAIEAEKCDANILVAFTSLEQSRGLAKRFPHFDVLVTCGGAGEPTMVPERIVTDKHVTQMVQVGTKGMFVGIVGFFSDDEKPIRYQRVPLDDRFEDSEEVKAIFIDYQEQLKGLGLKGLSIKPLPHPSGRRYAGSEACYDCHDEEWEIWRHGVEMDEDQDGPHWRATLDLTEPTQRVFVKRHFDPECLSCHVTGWNPQNYYPYFSGYLKLEEDVLHGNGCENCHGPAYEHVQAENGDVDASEELLQKYRDELHVSMKEARDSLCIECHDLDNSPDYHDSEIGGFDRYWEKVKHGDGK